MKKDNIKIAVVTHPLDTLGGAENMVKALVEEFPQAEIYTARSDRKFVFKEFKNTKVHNSFIQHIPFEKFFRKELFILYPLAYRQFALRKYDVVISICDGFPKFVKPRKSKTKHIAFILTPPKFLWMQEDRTTKESNRLSFRIYKKFVGTFLEKIWKKWDMNAAKRADHILCISQEVQKRVKTFYGLDSEVIYPPVNVKEIKLNKFIEKRESWFLYLGRVETYKGIELVIRACHMVHKPLKIAGVGQHLEQMKDLVKQLNARGTVKFLGYFEDDKKYDLLHRCKALIFPVRGEDFGIVPVEANAAGSPVIAFQDGGVVETISPKNPKTGIFFKQYTPESLAKVLENFDIDEFDPANCRKQASQFAKEIFQYKVRIFVENIFKNND